MNQPKRIKPGPIIGIAGHARSGKDKLGQEWASLLRENGIEANCYAFADALKASTDAFLLKELKISAYTEDPEEKLIIRPFLVFWGTEIMRKIDDEVWVNRLTDQISCRGINIITDLRFPNELKWINDNDGHLFMINRVGVGPANESEKTNNTILCKKIPNSLTLGEIGSNKIYRQVAAKQLSCIIPNKTLSKWQATYPL